ncbi:hypothetical protein LguiA_001874 [Lonicera macranthoides]
MKMCIFEMEWANTQSLGILFWVAICSSDCKSEAPIDNSFIGYLVLWSIKLPALYIFFE